MYTNKTKRRVITLLIIPCLMILCLTIIFQTKNLLSANADAQKNEYVEAIENFNGSANVGLFAGKKDKEEPDGIINIAGAEKGDVDL